MTISLCITCYHKDVHLLDTLLELFKQQTHAPYEIIVYSSGIENIAIQKKIIISNVEVPIYSISSSKVTMQSVARNICSSIASGNILMFFDVDDLPHSQKIEITEYVFSHNDIDFFLHNYARSNSDFKLINIKTILLLNNLSIDYNSTNISCMNYPIHHSHIAVRKNIFNTIKFNEDILAYRKEDGLFCQSLINKNFHGLYTPEKLVVYT